MTYLEDAAAELAKARAANDRRFAEAGKLDDAKLRGADEIRAEAATRSLEIAEALTRLAAIGAGLPPCCHPPRPAQEEAP